MGRQHRSLLPQQLRVQRLEQRSGSLLPPATAKHLAAPKYMATSEYLPPCAALRLLPRMPTEQYLAPFDVPPYARGVDDVSAAK